MELIILVLKKLKKFQKNSSMKEKNIGLNTMIAITMDITQLLVDEKSSYMIGMNKK